MLAISIITAILAIALSVTSLICAILKHGRVEPFYVSKKQSDVCKNPFDEQEDFTLIAYSEGEDTNN